MQHSGDVFWTKEMKHLVFSIIAGFFYFVALHIFSALLSLTVVGKPTTEKDVVQLYVIYLEVSFYIWMLVSLFLTWHRHPFEEKTTIAKIGTGSRLVITYAPIVCGFLVMTSTHKESWYIIGTVVSSIMLFVTLHE